jgi:hypothetical protein
MGAYTSPNQVWYPDLTDIGQLNTLLATLAQSVDAGIGARLQKQEIAVGLKAGLASAVTLTTTFTLMPMVITSNNACFNKGFNFAGGVATVVTPGMYMVSAGIGVTNQAGSSSKMSLRLNGVSVVEDEQSSSGTIYQASKNVSVVNCVAGDTISLYGSCGSATIPTSANLALTHLSIAMVQAVIS